ncbi:glycosyltransferase family 2 protein [Geodermatophilus sp. SYSU D00804]
MTARVVAVLVVKDEAPRLPFLLDYYRRLGVDHFIVVDNESTDGTVALLGDEPDVSIFRARGDFKRARYGTDWVNHLLKRYCIGKWILFVDADEFLVYHPADYSLPQVCAALQRAGRRSLQTIMLDMYSTEGVAPRPVRVGQDPLEVCDAYDVSGYLHAYARDSDARWIKGGVRGRLFFENLWEGPALNKTPLVHWRRSSVFLRVAHLLWPRRLNGGREPLRGAILHYKFTSSAIERMTDPNWAARHTDEYLAYARPLPEQVVETGVTRRYKSPQDLVDAGVIHSLSGL